VIEHGTRSRYTKYGCHCAACTKANTDYGNELKRRHKQGLFVRKPLKEVKHGRGRYVNPKYKCRCDICIQANRDYSRDWMRNKYSGIEWNDPLIEEELKQ
jgi:hypothetical protein